jgi:hypothetical protein
MCSDRIELQSAAELAEALRLGGRRGLACNDVLKEISLIKGPALPRIRNRYGTLGRMWVLEIRMT